jgi:signal transduction histidine kinase
VHDIRASNKCINKELVTPLHSQTLLHKLLRKHIFLSVWNIRVNIIEIYKNTLPTNTKHKKKTCLAQIINVWMQSFGLWQCVDLHVVINILEEHGAYIFRVEEHNLIFMPLKTLNLILQKVVLQVTWMGTFCKVIHYIIIKKNSLLEAQNL